MAEQLDAIKIREMAVIPEKDLEICKNCCWFYDEDSVGCGYCACKKSNDVHPVIVDCSDSCDDDYVSRKDMRHHMAVLLQYHRADEGMNYRFPGGDALEEAVVFAYRYMKVFNKL